MKICMIGLGAMGSLYSALLARSGAQIQCFDNWREHIDAIQSSGLRLSGITGDFTIDVHATTNVDDLDKSDLCIVQVNTHQTEEAARIAAKVLDKEGYCLTLQNGVGNIEKLSDELGRERVLGGLSYHSAAVREPGHVAHTHAGPTWLGELGGAPTERLATLENTLISAGFEPRIVGDIEGFIWGKFIHNCSINAICAAAGIRVGEIQMYQSADEFQTKIIDEVVAVVKAKGITVPEDDPKAAIKKFCKVKFNRPSMLQHLQSGRRTEIDALNGVVVYEGRKLGIPTPFNEALTLMVRAMDERNHEHANGTPDFAMLEHKLRSKISDD